MSDRVHDCLTLMCPCRPASLHTREGQSALWEFPRDHRCEGRPRHHHGQLWTLPAHSQLRLRFHHQRQRSCRRKRRLRRGPGGLWGWRMGPHDHWHQQWHRSSRLQHGPRGSDALTRRTNGAGVEWRPILKRTVGMNWTDQMKALLSTDPRCG